ncbi:hypothetical protein CPB85DRAFT_1256012 [Mucidula mucida]|nr:hypothetical protein CPB85DRAFT_1256012 [Mucidula mucida]
MAKMRSQVRHDIDRVVAEIKFVEAQLGSRVSFLTINQLSILSFFNRVCFRQDRLLSLIHKETDFFPLQVPKRPEKNSEYIPVQHGKRWRWNHSASSTNVRRVGIYRTSRKGQKKRSLPYFPPQADRRPPFKGIDTSWPSQTFRTVANLLLARVPRSPIIAFKSPNSAETRHQKLSATAQEQVREPGALQTFIPKCV